MIPPPTNFYQGDKINDEMGGTCGMHEREDKCIQSVSRKT